MKIVPTFIWLFFIFFLGQIAIERLNNPSGSDLIGKQANKIVTTQIADYPAIPDDLIQVENEVILLNFFASWCAPCKQEHPLLLQLSKDYALTLIGVVTRDSSKRAQIFLNENGNPYNYLGLDKMDTTMLNFKLKGLPESYLMNNKGEVLAHHSGVLTDEVIATKFLKYLQTK